jgi:hypothetical protein
VALLGLLVSMVSAASGADPEPSPPAPWIWWGPSSTAPSPAPPSFDDLIPKNAAAAFDAYDRRDYATALRLLRPLAEDGNAAAQLDLGIMYSDGLGVPKNPVEGVKWYRFAASQGNVPQNYAEAVRWYRLVSRHAG